jgi:hypothetical protein
MRKDSWVLGGGGLCCVYDQADFVGRLGAAVRKEGSQQYCMMMCRSLRGDWLGVWISY